MTNEKMVRTATVALSLLGGFAGYGQAQGAVPVIPQQCKALAESLGQKVIAVLATRGIKITPQLAQIFVGDEYRAWVEHTPTAFDWSSCAPVQR